MSQVFRVCVLVHGLRFCVRVLFYCCTLHMSVWPALFCQTGWMRTRIQLYYGFIRPGVHLIMYASSLTPGIIVIRVHALICARSSEYREAFRQEAASIVSFRTRGQDPRVTRVALRQAAASSQKYGSAGQICGSDPRVGRKQLTGHCDPTRE